MYGRLGELAFKEMLPGREACQEDFLSAFWVRYLLVLGGAVPVPEVEVFGQPGPAAFFPSLVVGATFLSPGGPPLAHRAQANGGVAHGVGILRAEGLVEDLDLWGVDVCYLAFLEPGLVHPATAQRVGFVGHPDFRILAVLRVHGPLAGATIGQLPTDNRGQIPIIPSSQAMG